MNLEQYKESKQKLVELKEQQAVMCKEACDNATGDLKKEINSLEVENKKERILLQEKNAQAFRDAAPRVAEIFKMCFLLQAIKGIGIKPTLAYTMKAIEIWDFKEFTDDEDKEYDWEWCRYAQSDEDSNEILICDNGGIDRAYEIVKCIYDKNFKDPT